MKKLNTFAAAAVALGIGLAPQANAEITLESNGVGDALLFPVYNGYIENYFTVSNHSNLFVQGHLRFRGGAWSGEFRDLDVILTPGDVLIFRIADLDGDGRWEIDQSLDVRTSTEISRGDKPMTFETNGMVKADCGVQESVPPCIKPERDLLMPTFCPEVGAVVDTSGMSDENKYLVASCDYQRHVGYVEFIGEAVLDNMTHEIMKILVDRGHTDSIWGSYVTEQVNERRSNMRSGTSAWKWSAAQFNEQTANYSFNPCNATFTNNPCNRGLSDVGNWLSGTAFITIPGQSLGVAYNAEAFNNFRTSASEHRVDNYDYTGGSTVYNTDGTVNNRGVDTLPQAIGLPTAVILHNENGDVTPVNDYVYGCYQDIGNNTLRTLEISDDELVVSFNNTWGPTLADGDDTITDGSSVPNTYQDSFDAQRNTYADWIPSRPAINARVPITVNDASINSIEEVEQAIAANDQVYYSYYFDNMSFDRSNVGVKSTVKSHYFGFFPTKFYYGENLARAHVLTCKGYLDDTVRRLLIDDQYRSKIHAEVWNANEERCVMGSAPKVGTGISPIFFPIENAPAGGPALGYELSYWNIDWLKSNESCPSTGFESGRVVIGIQNPATSPPGLLYTFEQNSNNIIGNWRAMQR